MSTDEMPVLEGACLKSFLPLTRDAETAQTIAVGEEMDYFAAEGLEPLSARFQWTGATWKSARSLRWKSGVTSASFTAFYPPLPEDSYYDAEGLLRMRYYAKGKMVRSQVAKLQFVPLYTRLSFQLPQSLQGMVSRVDALPSHHLSSVRKEDAVAVLVGNETGTPVSLVPGEDGIYSLLLPVGNASVTLSFHCTDQRLLRAVIPTSSMQAGIDYVCRLRYDTPSVPEGEGIMTADQLVDWLLLVWSESKDSTQLSRFGVRKDGQWHYKIGADITMTPESLARLKAESKTEGGGFSDVLDGQHHTIKGLDFNHIVINGRSAFLPIIRSGGFVRNLCLEDFRIVVNPMTSFYFAAGIAGTCYGRIERCVVRNAKLTVLGSFRYLAGLVGELRPHKEGEERYMAGIYDSAVLNLNIEAKVKKGSPVPIGGLVGSFNMSNSVKCRVESCLVDGFTSTPASYSLGYADKDYQYVLNCLVMGCRYPLSVKSFGFNYIVYPETVKPAFKEGGDITVFTYSETTLSQSPQTLTSWLEEQSGGNPQRSHWVIGKNGRPTFDYLEE